MARRNEPKWIMAAVAMLIIGATSKPRRRGSHASAPLVEWSDYDMRAFVSEVAPIGVPLDAALMVYTAESGLDPRASSGIGWGVPQLTARTAKDLGWTRPIREFATLPVSQQAPWIAKLMAYQARMIGFVPTTALDLYVANLSPRAAREHADVLYRAGTDAYEKNASLDTGSKGFIDRRDLQASLNRAAQTETYRRALAQLRRVQNG